MNDSRWLRDADDAGLSALRQALDDQSTVRPSDVRRRRVWTRMERSEAGQRATRKAFIAGALAVSAVTAIVTFAVQRLPRWKTAPEIAVRPAPLPQRAALTPVVASPPREPPPFSATGSLVETAPGEHVTRRLAGGVRADLQPSAALFVGGPAEVEVRRGEVRFDVPLDVPLDAGGRGPRTALVVRITAAYRVISAGARFSVRVDDAGTSRVVVDDGAAEIWRRGRITRLGPGESWSAQAQRRRVIAYADVGAGRSRSRDAARAPVRDDATELAAAREVSGRDPARAIELYEQMAAGGGSAAQNALYEIGAIYHDRLHDRARAVAAWERYRVRYPRGLLRAEADLSILDALAAMGRRSRALEEALGFLKRHPASERRGEVARVGADLARGLGQCRLAADLYSEVAGAHISTDDADDAAFGRAACLAAVSDPRAAAAVDAYLAAHPRGRHVVEAQRLAGTGGHAP